MKKLLILYLGSFYTICLIFLALEKILLVGFFKIERGCKQGDPIASYLFLLCGQILFYLICQNDEIKGIQVGQEEIKLSQFADDTTIILDGSYRSFEAALNVIEIFGNISGLKMNTTKTKLIWIGDKRHSTDKLPMSYRLEWEQLLSSYQRYCSL